MKHEEALEIAEERYQCAQAALAAYPTDGHAAAAHLYRAEFYARWYDVMHNDWHLREASRSIMVLESLVGGF